ncbi:MAG TPA: hypothetical protein VIX37_13880, partial [Candidatus Sulfotelmatobacter sp.]
SSRKDLSRTDKRKRPSQPRLMFLFVIGEHDEDVLARKRKKESRQDIHDPKRLRDDAANRRCDTSNASIIFV